MEVVEAIRTGLWEPAKAGRTQCRREFPFHATWQGTPYAVKQVRPIFVEEADEIVVVTVYAYYIKGGAP